jgi:Protein of unknown function (DUF3618)
MTAPDPATADELQREIELTRERLGETVEQLAAKADVKAPAQAKVAQVKAQARSKAVEMKAQARSKAVEVSELMRQNEMARRWPLALTAAGVLMMGAAVIWRWRT